VRCIRIVTVVVLVCFRGGLQFRAPIEELLLALQRSSPEASAPGPVEIEERQGEQGDGSTLQGDEVSTRHGRCRRQERKKPSSLYKLSLSLSLLHTYIYIYSLSRNSLSNILPPYL
jgi:hypothetical protein